VTEIQQNRWDQLVRRAANIVGGGSQVNDTLNELFPVIDIERVPGELLFLSGTKMAVCGSQLNQSALNTNHHQLFNPAGSGIVATVSSIFLNSGTTQSIRAAFVTTAITTLVGNELVRDTRLGVVNSPVLQNRTVQQVAGVALIYQWRVLADTTLKISDDNGVCVLFPGTGLTVATTIINTVSTVNFLWRERVFEPAEINF